jgi:hypothetical protein
MNRTALTLAALLIALIAAACQQDSGLATAPAPAIQAPADDAPEAQPTPEAQPEVEPTPEVEPQPEIEPQPEPQPEVEPQPEAQPEPRAEVARLALTLSPQRPFYQVGDEIQAQVQVLDAQGNMIDDAQIAFSNSARLVAGGAPNTWRVVAEGDADLSACVGAICQRAHLIADNAPPRLELTSPQAAELVSSDTLSDEIEVRGYVSDTHAPRLEVFVNGISAAIDASTGGFVVRIPAAPGLNELLIEAQDGVWPQGEAARADFLYARRFVQAPAGGAQISRGAVSALGVEGVQALEGGLQQRWQAGAWRPAGTALLSRPDRYIARAGVNAQGEATARALVDPERLQLELRVTGYELSLAGFLRYGERVLNVQGDLSASFLLITTGRWDEAAGAWRLSDTSVHVDQLNLTRSGAARAEWPTPDNEHLLRETVAGLLQEQLQGAWAAPTFAEAARALSAPGQAWRDQTLRASGLDGRALEVSLRLGAARRAGALELVTTRDVTVASGRAARDGGALLHLGAPVFSTQEEAQQGLALEVFNAALLQLWRQGALEDEILAVSGDDATPLRVAAALPPVLVPSVDPAHTLQLQIGAWELRRGDQVLARATARVDVDLVAAEGGAVLMGHAPQLTVEADPALPVALQAVWRERVTEGAALLTEALTQVDVPAPAATALWPLASQEATLRGQYLQASYGATP